MVSLGIADVLLKTAVTWYKNMEEQILYWYPFLVWMRMSYKPNKYSSN